MSEWLDAAVDLRAPAGRIAVVYPADRLAELEFLRLTLPGYGVVLLVCLYILWTFGRLDGLPPQEVLHHVLVLAFPGSLGAATARLVL